MYEIEYTDEYGAWHDEQSIEVQRAIVAVVEILEEHGPKLGRPYVDTMKGGSHANLKELRVQYRGQPYRLFFAFDPKQTAIVLIGGCKAGDKRFYQRMIPLADRLYETYLKETVQQ